MGRKKKVEAVEEVVVEAPSEEQHVTLHLDRDPNDPRVSRV